VKEAEDIIMQDANPSLQTILGDDFVLSDPYIISTISSIGVVWYANDDAR
jgi:hypothetical protein